MIKRGELDGRVDERGPGLWWMWSLCWMYKTKDVGN